MRARACRWFCSVHRDTVADPQSTNYFRGPTMPSPSPSTLDPRGMLTRQLSLGIPAHQPWYRSPDERRINAKTHGLSCDDPIVSNVMMSGASGSISGTKLMQTIAFVNK